MSLHERELQKQLHELLSDPAQVYSTLSGKRLQILSPGRINPHEGPDFKDVAILLEGMIIIGDAEFHRNANEWYAHGHQNDKNYENVVLHICFDKGSKSFNHEMLILNETDLLKANPGIEQLEVDLHSVEDLQHYALLRLLRKTAEAQKLIIAHGLLKALKNNLISFIRRYNSRRRRPVYTEEKLIQIIEHIENTDSAKFLSELDLDQSISIPDRMQELLRKKLTDEGSHLRREIMLNCILPLALCIASEEKRIDLFLWFWSTPSLHKYGLLTRKFPDIPQNFLWQQQGMLEFIKEHGRKPNVVSEALVNYGFAEILSFYRVGRAPFNPVIE